MEIKANLAVLALRNSSESGMNHEQGYTESVLSLFYHYSFSDLTPPPRGFHT